MTKWEYKEIDASPDRCDGYCNPNGLCHCAEKFFLYLQASGAEGWKLIAFHGDTAYLMREYVPPPLPQLPETPLTQWEGWHKLKQHAYKAIARAGFKTLRDLGTNKGLETLKTTYNCGPSTIAEIAKQLPRWDRGVGVGHLWGRYQE